MSQLLALEWDGSEARLAVASTRGTRVVVEQAFSVPLRSGQEGGERTDVDVGARIAEAMAKRGIGRIDTLVAVGRSSIELRQLTVPPVPDDELPEIVRFQAMREFNELDEDWLLDFIPLDTPPDGPRSVLAAAIDPKLVGQIQATCQTAGVKPRRVILRPCAAASLFGRAQPDGPAALQLLVDLLSEEADLTVMSDRRVVFLRTTRLPGDPLDGSEHVPALIGEIRRTMAAAQNQLGGRRVEAIVLCGLGDQHAALARLMQENLGTPTSLFDPFAGLDVGPDLRESLPDHPGRFAPLLGMLLAELEETPHAIDFLHPRRRAVPPSRRKQYIAAAVAVGVLVVAYFTYGRIASALLQNEIDDLKAKLESAEPKAKLADAVYRKAKKLEDWIGGDVRWLDELDRLSKKFPKEKKEAMIRSLVFAAVDEATKAKGTTAKGVITLNVLAEKPAIMEKVGTDLRDSSHEVQSGKSGEDNTEKFYSYWFGKTVVIKDPEKK